MKEFGLDDRHRDKDGRISRKHGNTLIQTLRETYGMFSHISAAPCVHSVCRRHFAWERLALR